MHFDVLLDLISACNIYIIVHTRCLPGYCENCITDAESSSRNHSHHVSSFHAQNSTHHVDICPRNNAQHRKDQVLSNQQIDRRNGVGHPKDIINRQPKPKNILTSTKHNIRDDQETESDEYGFKSRSHNKSRGKRRSYFKDQKSHSKPRDHNLNDLNCSLRDEESRFNLLYNHNLGPGSGLVERNQMTRTNQDHIHLNKSLDSPIHPKVGISQDYNSVAYQAKKSVQNVNNRLSCRVGQMSTGCIDDNFMRDRDPSFQHVSENRVQDVVHNSSYGLVDVWIENNKRFFLSSNDKITAEVEKDKSKNKNARDDRLKEDYNSLWKDKKRHDNLNHSFDQVLQKRQHNRSFENLLLPDNRTNRGPQIIHNHQLSPRSFLNCHTVSAFHYPISVLRNKESFNKSRESAVKLRGTGRNYDE